LTRSSRGETIFFCMFFVFSTQRKHEPEILVVVCLTETGTF
jgi:hypothetical protein